ncbi:MAG: helix-turn-helix domain-containing protein [Bacteroidales bacterium]|nr:helix-turn-helix domain-containing protein [Bacteroidales bacterium]
MNFRGVKSCGLAIALLGAAIFPSQAQDRFEDGYLCSTLSMENGLPCNFIDDVCQDSAGFLWLATSGGGLCRFDGYDLLTFSATSGTPLKSNFIRNICEDRFHRLWIASEGGLDLLDLGTLDRLDLPDPALEAFGDQLCSFLTLDAAGNLWLKTGKTLVRVSFDGEGDVREVLEFTHEGLSPTNFVFEDVDGDGTVWAGLEGRLYKIGVSPSGRLQADPILPGFQFGEQTYLSDFLPAGQGIWISTENGLYFVNRRTGEWKRYAHDPRNPRSLTQNFITGLARTGDGETVAVSLHGLNLFNPVTDDFERIGGEVINCIKVNGDQIQLGTETAGLQTFMPKQLSVNNFRNDERDPRSLPAGAVNAVFQEPDGRLWVGTVEGGLSVREPGSLEFGHLTRELDGLSHDSVCEFCLLPQDRMLVGTWGGGIDIVSTRKPYRVLEHLLPGDTRLDYIGSLDYDPESGLLWIGANRGVYFYDFATHVLTPALEDQASGCIGSCLDASGKLWIGCREGLYAFDLKARGADGRYPATLYPYKLDAPESRVREMICCMIEAADGSLWLGSNGNGVYHGIRDGGDAIAFKGYTTRDGLSNDRVRGLAEDAAGHIWISTEHGLNVLDPANGRITPYFREDGLASTQFHWNNACRGTDGLLYFGQVEGLSAVDPVRTVARTMDGPLRLTGVRIGDRQLRNPCLKQVRMHERDRSILFQFALLSPAARRQYTYEYRLEGFEKGWTRLNGDRHEASYSALPSGEYQFVVRAIPRSGNAEKELTLEVDVRPYFYKTWWFKLLLAALIAAIAYGILTWRTRALVRQQELLQRTVDERTREISEQKKLVEQKADELARQNVVLRHQNEELAGRRILAAPQGQPEDPFADKVLQTVRALYKDPDLDVPALCSAMGMSKTLLNKRIQEAFGQPVAQFIRTYRLSVAREMLRTNRENKTLNISEIAYEVGFNDPKYFSRCFAKEFGFPPSNLAED